MINIGKADKAEVLMRLVNRADNSGASHPKMVAVLTRKLPKITLEKARELTAGRRQYFDYVEGRAVKIYLDRDTVDERNYDENNGKGAAREALSGILGIRFLVGWEWCYPNGDAADLTCAKAKCTAGKSTNSQNVILATGALDSAWGYRCGECGLTLEESYLKGDSP